MRRQIRLEEILSAHAYAINSAHYRCWPGIVEAYYPPVAGQSPATVDVQIAVQDVRIDTDSGELVYEPWPIVPRVPVAFPRFGGRAVWGPLAKGDDLMMVSFDLDPSTFLSTGQHSKPVFTRRNGGNFWWAYPGSICDPHGLPDPGDALMVGTPGGPVIAIDGTKVSLGAAGATDAVALATKIDLLIKVIMSWTPASGDGGAALQTALTVAGFTATTSVASSVVKAAP